LTQKLHILFICGWFPSKVSPTNGDFIQRHAEAVATKHAVSVIHIISDEKTDKECIEINQENAVNIYIGYVRKTKNPLLKISRFWKIFHQIIKTIDSFDVVHLNKIYPFGIFAFHLKRKFKKPYIISEHWTAYQIPNVKQIGFFQKIVSKIITKNATYVCPISDHLSKSMQQFGLQGNFKTVANVVNTIVFCPQQKENNLFTILHVSSLNDKQKNISGMLRVVKKLQETNVDFIWKFIGGTSDEILELMSKLNINTTKVEFIPHVSQIKLATHLQQANVCVSFSNYETFGIVMAESIACGTPVISTNTGILNELKSEEFFKIIPLKDEDKLFQELLNYQKNPKIYDSKKMNSFISEKFSVNVIANEFSLLYEKALKN
jgi:glycosyltransferase involved in cell wall biosynthesis